MRRSPSPLGGSAGEVSTDVSSGTIIMFLSAGPCGRAARSDPSARLPAPPQRCAISPTHTTRSCPPLMHVGIVEAHDEDMQELVPESQTYDYPGVV